MKGFIMQTMEKSFLVFHYEFMSDDTLAMNAFHTAKSAGLSLIERSFVMGLISKLEKKRGASFPKNHIYRITFTRPEVMLPWSKVKIGVKSGI